MFRGPVAAVAALSLLGCTSVQVIDRPSAPTLQHRLEVGERVSVLTTTQHHYDLKVTSVDEASFAGRDSSDKAWVVRYDQVEQIQARRFDGWKTTGLVAGIVATLYVALLIFFHHLEDDIDDSFNGN